MNTHGGYSKKTLTNTNVLLAGGGDKSLADFLGGIQYVSASHKILIKTAEASASWTDLVTLVTTDENVKLTPKTDNANRPLMMINGGTSAGELISTSMFSTGIYANASTKMITAAGFIKTGSDSSHVLLGDGSDGDLDNLLYWANVKVSTQSSTSTTPTFGNTTTAHLYMGGYLFMKFNNDSGWLATIDNDGNGPIFGHALALNNRRTYFVGSPAYICGGSYGNYASGITVTSSNNVGVGTTSPSYKFHVNGYIGLHEGLIFTRENWNYICVPATNGNLSFNVGDAGTDQTKMCIKNGGNVGIGTTSPGYKLDVDGDIRSNGFHHLSHNNNDSVLLAGGSWKELSDFSMEHSHPYLYSEQVGETQTNVTWAINYSNDQRRAFVYNTSGTEYSYLFGLSSSNATINGSATYSQHGAILKMGYADKYLRILRVYQGKWYKTDGTLAALGSTAGVDWEKISAGYADNADTVDNLHAEDFVYRKHSTNIYNFIEGSSYSGSGWYKVTFPHAHTTASYTYWFMLSMDIIFGGSYSSGPNGKVRLSYYFSRGANAYTTSKGNVYGVAFGNDLSNIRICYDPNDAGYMYIYNGGQYYATVTIKNLTITDNGLEYNYLNTTIAPCDAPSGVLDVTINKIYSNAGNDMLLNGNTIIHSNNISSYAVTSFGSKTGAITLLGGLTGNGAINLSMNGNQLLASIVGLGSNAYDNTAYLPLAGGKMTQATSPLKFTENKLAIEFRDVESSNLTSRVQFMTSGNEALVFSNQYASTSYIFKCGYKLVEGSDWYTQFSSNNVPTLQMKALSVYVNSFINNNVSPSYNFLVGGTSYLDGQTIIKGPSNALANDKWTVKIIQGTDNGTGNYDAVLISSGDVPGVRISDSDGTQLGLCGGDYHSTLTSTHDFRFYTGGTGNTAIYSGMSGTLKLGLNYKVGNTTWDAYINGSLNVTGTIYLNGTALGDRAFDSNTYIPTSAKFWGLSYSNGKVEGHIYVDGYYYQKHGDNFIPIIDRSGGPIFGYGCMAANLHSYYVGKTVSITAGTDYSAKASGIYLTDSNNVGVGKTNPSYKFDVNGTIGVFESLNFTRESWNYITVPSTNGVLSFNIGAAGTAQTKMCILNNGNVGIGKTDPGYALDVNGVIKASSSIYMGGYLYMPFGGEWLSTIDNDGNGPIFGYLQAVKGRRVYLTGSPVYITGGGYGTGGITVNSNNNVGISNTSPSYKLDVSGDVYASGFRHSAVNANTHVILAGGGTKALTELATSTHNHDSIYVKKLDSSHFYPFIGSSYGNSVYKVTFPTNAATSTSWMMISFEIVFGGPYSSGTTGRLYVAYYVYRDSNGWVLRDGRAIGIGTKLIDNNISLAYLTNNPNIFYVKVNGHSYTSFAIENVTANDSAPGYDFRNTTIETTSSIPSGTTAINITLLDTADGTTLKVNNNVYAPNYYTTSDRNKKTNISSFSEHIRKFQLKDTEKYAYGVIALEVPEMFRDGEEGNMTVNYNSVLSFYIGSLENKVKMLEERIKRLESK